MKPNDSNEPAVEPSGGRPASHRRYTSRRLRRLSLVALAAAAAALVILLNSCVSTVTPPADPEDACRVYVVDEPYHAGVVLPDDRTGGYVEYGYGEWDWYALERNSWYHIFDTILWSTTGCLRRRELGDWNVDREEAGGRLTPVVVSAAAARELLADLDEMFDAGRDTLFHHHAYDMDFVQVDRGYWFWHNCNDATAEWLERLGCRVSGAWIRTALRIAEP